jgi:hypothetical protein
MLTVLALYPKFLRSAPRVRSRVILAFWVSQFCKKNEKKYTKLPLTSLYEEALKGMEVLLNLTSGGRVTMPFTQSVKDMLVSLHVNVFTAIEPILQQKKSS